MDSVGTRSGVGEKWGGKWDGIPISIDLHTLSPFSPRFSSWPTVPFVKIDSPHSATEECETLPPSDTTLPQRPVQMVDYVACVLICTSCAMFDRIDTEEYFWV